MHHDELWELAASYALETLSDEERAGLHATLLPIVERIHTP